MIRLECLRYGYSIVDDSTGKDVFIQSSDEYPGVASAFGWSLKARRLPDANGRRTYCYHRGTDGSVPCPDCGAQPRDFRSSAEQYLDEHHGALADDPGYFAG